MGWLLVRLFKTGSFYGISTIYSLLLTVSIWGVSAIVCALPFYLSRITYSFTDAIFESVSCLTTTGYTLFSDEPFLLSESLLFWRVFLQWVGGIGIVFMAVSLLPALKIGGSHLIGTEFSDRSGKSISSHLFNNHYDLGLVQRLVIDFLSSFIRGE